MTTDTKLIENTNIRNETYKRKNNNRLKEIIWHKIFLICACVTIISVFAITVFIFVRGTPAIVQIGFFDFVFGPKWKPSAELYGIFPMVVGSIYVTIGSIIIGVPIGIFAAAFLAELCPKWIYTIIKPAVELLAGIPSVVYGFFGLVVLVPFISRTLGGPGNSLLAASIILGVMILPTIINISESSIRAVPQSYKEGSLAMGASHIQTIFRVILPAARSGILAGVILGIGRAIGETMAVILIAGNTTLIPKSILDPLRTMTANIALEMNYAFGLHMEALFGTGVILFIFIMVLNLILNLCIKRAGDAK